MGLLPCSAGRACSRVNQVLPTSSLVRKKLFLVQRPILFIFSWTFLMTKSGYSQGRTQWECILNMLGIDCELSFRCVSSAHPVHGCLSSASAVSLHCVQWLLKSMISTPALLALTIGTIILLRISFHYSLSVVLLLLILSKRWDQKGVKTHTLFQFLRNFIFVTSKINFINHLLNLMWELFLLSLTWKFNLKWERRGKCTSFSL